MLRDALGMNLIPNAQISFGSPLKVQTSDCMVSPFFNVWFEATFNNQSRSSSFGSSVTDLCEQ